PRPGTDVELYVAARDRYYSYVDRFSRRPDAKVRVDKLPLRSGDAAFVSKLMPDMRFIFAVRHPFDVVLSCFKQRFGVNPAMANLHTIEEASRFYAFVMEQWFSVHSLDDPRVHYVRYHELVTDFQNVASGTLRFLGLDWDDDVEDFATKATGRRAKTPSYQKVRQGLSIGVQSNWKKYDFVFKSPAADPLRPWVRHFGYEDA
ncbi:MAG: sulfotransferase, partial [Gemmatimonas sp.]